jgi:cytoskeletal protein CcmA (bactofilin family)
MANFFYLTTSGTYTTGYFQSMAAGDYTYVASGVNLFGGFTNGTGANDYGIYDSSYGTVEVAGTLIGPDPVYLTGASAGTNDVQIDQGGKVVTDVAGGSAVTINTGAFDITNNGLISATTNVNNYSYDIAINNGGGAGTIYNYGSMTSAGFALEDLDTTATNTDVLYNYGQIFGTAGGVYYYADAATIYNYGTIGSQDTWGFANGTSGAITALTALTLDNFGQITGGVYDSGKATINNDGTIQGNLQLGGSPSAFVNNAGTINGEIFFNSGATLTDSGTITGGLLATSDAVNLYDAQLSIAGAGDTVNFLTGPNDLVTFAGNSAWAPTEP